MRIAAQIRTGNGDRAGRGRRARRARRSAGSGCSCAQLPSYQDEIQAWVTAELGLALDYTRLDARLGLARPRARVPRRARSRRRRRDAVPDRARRERRLRRARSRCSASRRAASSPSTGSRSTAPSSRSSGPTEGAYRLQGAPAVSGEQATVQVPPDIEVLVRNSRVLYLDAARSIAWAFQDVAGSLRRDDEVLTVEARGSPPPEFADRIEVTAQAFVADDGERCRRAFTGDWRLSADLDDVDLAVAARLFPPSAVAPQAGRGDVAVWLDWQGGAVAGGTVELALADVDAAERRSAPSIRASSASRCPAIGSARATRGSSRCATSPSRAAAALGLRPRRSTSTSGATQTASTAFALRSSFLRLEDLTPFFAPLPESRLLESWFALAPRGDLSAVDLALDAHRGRRHRLHGGGRFRGARHRDVRRTARHHGAHGPSARRLARGTARARERGRRARLAGVVPRRARRARAARHRRLARRPGRRARRQRRPARRHAGRVAAHAISSSRCRWTSSSPHARSAHERVGVRHRGRAAVLAREQDARDRRRVARLGAARRASDERRRHVRRARARVPVRRRRRRVPRDRRRSRTVELAFVSDWPCAEDLDGTVEFANARFAARGSGRVLGNRTADMRVGIGDLRAGRFHVAGRHDRRARSSARVPERRAVDRALSRRGFRAARSAEPAPAP